MKLRNIFLVAAGVMAIPLSVTSAQTAQPWQAPYAGQDLNGTNVIGLWKFDGEMAGRDVSGRGHNLTLRGPDSLYVAEGKFGGALQVGDQNEPGDKRQGAQAPDKDSLTPAGAFTVEMWIAPDQKIIEQPLACLLDKKYYYSTTDNPRANHDYMFLLRRSGTDKFLVEVQLGFGKDSEIVRSAPQSFTFGQWSHVAFSYDGQGDVAIYRDGARIGGTLLKERGAVSNGPQNLVIGDRVGSTGARFLGKIDEVRITGQVQKFVSGQVLLQTQGSRTAFLRNEKTAHITVSVFNDTLAPLANALLHVEGNGGAGGQDVPIPTVAAGREVEVKVPVDTSLRPARYQLTALVQTAQKKTLSEPVGVPLTIVPRPLPHGMPVVMWAGATSNYQELKDVGFTGQLVSLADYKKIWDEEGKGLSVPDSRAAVLRDSLDRLFALGLGGYATLTPGRTASSLHPEFNRTDRTGKTVDNIDGLYPRVQQFARDTGVAVARTFGDMPGWQGALLHTEVRDHAVPSFNEIDKKTYREHSGEDIPLQVTSARGVSYNVLPEFPVSRIVRDDHPLLKYYRWYWRTGDGWNTLNSELHDGLKSTGRNDMFTWFDPATRVPSLYGSGGKVDYLNQWTYTYPDPLKIGLAADELLAMAGGRPGQKVMNMTQIIWYRTQTTRDPIAGKEAEWEKVSPDAKFISISPDHISEALWLNLSRPVQAIAYHGWGSLGENLGFKQGSYVTTNIQTRKRLAQLTRDVVQPLGPTLTQVPDAPTDVAFLQSFASQMLANRGTFGWGGGWGADSYMVALYAGLQPQIVYDETVVQKGLDQYKVLFLTHCDVLTEPVAAAIKKFQQRGGIIVGDEFLAPGIQPDILMSSFTRDKPHESKKTMFEKAAALRSELDTFYGVALESSNPEVLIRRRRFGSSDYIFTVNDNRTYGEYVGQHGRVMENGLPSQSQVTVNNRNGFVYDLMNRREVKTTRNGGNLQFTVDLGAGEGNVFLVTDKAVGALQVTAAPTAARGKTATVAVQLNAADGQPLQAVVPLEVTIRDPQGRVAEKSGYYGAANGKLNLTLDIASNDLPGRWQVEVSERLRGQKATANFEVK